MASTYPCTNIPMTTSFPAKDYQNQLNHSDDLLIDPFTSLSSGQENVPSMYNGLGTQSMHMDREWTSKVPLDDASYGIDGSTLSQSGYDAFSTFDREQPSLVDHNLGMVESSADTPYTHGTSQSYSGMSPPEAYMSEYETSHMDDYDAQTFDNEFLLEKHFGPLAPALDSTSDPTQTFGASTIDGLATIGNNPHNSQASYCTPPPPSAHWRSRTTHLMSPELTDSTSPGSSYGVVSPAVRTRLLGGGTMSRVSSQSTATEPTLSMRHHTPALTGSSAEASPEPPSLAEVGNGTSPVVRIESYSRGDSPARTRGSALRNSSKRSRASRSSSHLAAPTDDVSNEGENTDLVEDQPLSTTGQVTSTDFQEQHPHHTSNPRAGLNPNMRAEIRDQVIPNFRDQDELDERAAKKADVQEWLRKNSDPVQSQQEMHAQARIRKDQTCTTRRRARSTAEPKRLMEVANDINTECLAEANLRIPGPGLMLSEVSSDEDAEADIDLDFESAPTGVSEVAQIAEAAQGLKEESDAHPWSDPIYMPPRLSIIEQPLTSNAAIARFEERARDLETASRKATWATSIRRLSENDLDKIIGPEGLLSRFSISKDKIMETVDKVDRRLRPKRSNSNLKRKPNEVNAERPGLPLNTPHESQESLHGRKGSLQGRKESLGVRTESSSIRRMSSIGKRPKSPKVNTGGTIATMASHIAALGGNGSFSPTTTSAPTTAWTRNLTRLKRTAESDPNNAAEHGIAALWTKQGGPPLPTLASPPKENQDVTPFGPADEDEDGDTDENSNDKGVQMDFTPRDVPIIPTKEGFKNNIRELNPRLAPYLEDRLAQEQLRRFKKLVSFKVDHVQAVQRRACPSGNNKCFALGGKASFLPSKSSKKEPELSHTGFSVAGIASSDADANTLPDGVVTASQFQPGITLPPVDRLPAEFECPLCFTVKKIHKPSDWSKHVHEDLQPFTCTFPECSEPKSFKRKADWVRHENERHRQLEWWTCSKPDCQHKCYRRDNFVQHLVREHKLTEPNSKNTAPNRPAVRGPAKKTPRDKGHSSSNSCEDEVLALVASCRHETTDEPQSEPCRFCGNKSNSWKKLTVHLARHMEQLSLPVLKLVEQKDVTPDTVISPIEQPIPSHTINAAVAAERKSTSRESSGISPYEITLEMEDVKRELPGSFTPVHNVTAFNSPSRENQVTGAFPWGQPSIQCSQTRTEASLLAYSQNIGSSYDPSYSGYNPPTASQFAQMNTQQNHVQPSRPNNVMYNSQSAQPVGMALPTAIGPYQTPSVPFNGPRYVNQNGLPMSGPQSVPQNIAMSPPYGPHSRMAYPHVPNPPTAFQNEYQQYYSYPT